MFRVTLFGVFFTLALITVIPSRDLVLGSAWPPSNATQFAGNRRRCAAHWNDLIYEVFDLIFVLNRVLAIKFSLLQDRNNSRSFTVKPDHLTSVAFAIFYLILSLFVLFLASVFVKMLHGTRFRAKVSFDVCGSE